MLRFSPKDGTGCLSHFLGILFFIPWGAQLLIGPAVNLPFHIHSPLVCCGFVVGAGKEGSSFCGVN